MFLVFYCISGVIGSVAGSAIGWLAYGTARAAIFGFFCGGIGGMTAAGIIISLVSGRFPERDAVSYGRRKRR